LRAREGDKKRERERERERKTKRNERGDYKRQRERTKRQRDMDGPPSLSDLCLHRLSLCLLLSPLSLSFVISSLLSHR